MGLGLILLTGCGPTAVDPTLPPPTISPAQAPTQVLTASQPPAQPTDAVRAMIAALNTNHTPTYLRWFIFNPIHVGTASDNGTLVLTLKSRALWFMDQRGVLLYRLIRGNFRITAKVEARKFSDLTQAPEGPVVQLGGLMVRNPNPGPENYVFIVVGQDVNDLSVETKNTVAGVSKYDGPSWGSADAELRICRVGATFNLYKRPIGETEWALAQTVDRPDLPEIVQVGPNIYSDGEPDLQVRYDNLSLEQTLNEDDCTTD
jgi:hypothetical protein